jgi:flagellar basal-body rod protein FlgG
MDPITALPLDALTAVAGSMEGDLRRLESITLNIVNTATPGFKREIPIEGGFDAALSAAHAKSGEVHSNGAHAPTGLPRSDMTAGTIRHTGNPLDLALTDASLFFEVHTSGGTRYARAGNFQFDSAGRIATASGDVVTGERGEIQADGSDVTITSRGEVMQRGKSIGQIKIVQFEHPELMRRTADGMFEQSGALSVDLSHSNPVQVGYLEVSNVNAAREMIGMTQVVRHFETMQKVVQGYDEAMSDAIQKLGEF